jgi:octaprenyl-diphosphate synthase
MKGLEYAESKMFEFQKKAFDLISEFPSTESRESLEQLVRFTTERKK